MNTFKKFISSIILTAMLLGMFSAFPISVSASDMQGHLAEGVLDDSIDRGLPQSNLAGEYYPDSSITRAGAATPLSGLNTRTMGIAPAATTFAGGDGTALNPYLISTAAQLDAMRDVYNYDMFFKITNDIDLTSYLSSGGAGHAKWGSQGWQPIGSTSYDEYNNNAYPSNYFYGNVDGGGYKITGLWMDRASASNYTAFGLFGYFTSVAGVSNLGVEIAAAGIKVTTNTSMYVGGLAGYVSGRSSIIRCYTTGPIQATKTSGSSSFIVGGLVGYVSDGPTIIGSYSHSNITASVAGTGTNNYIGGFAGSLWTGNQNVTVTDCYSSGTVTTSGTTTASTGGFSGVLQYAKLTITKCHTVSPVTATWSTTGAFVGSISSGTPTVTDSYFLTGNGVDKAIGSGSISGSLTGKNATEMKTQATFANWNFTTVWSMGANYPVLPSRTLVVAPVVFPTAASLYEWQPLSLAKYSGQNNNGIAGTFSWLFPTSKPTFAQSGGAVIMQFVPDDLTTYKVTYRAIPLTVNRIFHTGTGTSANPYIITSALQLDTMRHRPVEYYDPDGQNYPIVVYYKLGSDIDLTSYLASGGDGYRQWGDDGWLPLNNSSSASLDGAGHKITGLWINRSNIYYVGLFDYITNKVSNLGVEIASKGIVITNTGSIYAMAGGLAGGISDSDASRGSIINCYTSGPIIVSQTGTNSSCVGGLIGAAYGQGTSIFNSYSNCDVSLDATGSAPRPSVGGFIGFCESTIKILNAFSSGTVTGSGNNIKAGGFMGFNSSYSTNVEITNCYTVSPVRGNVDTMGAFIGVNESTSSWGNYNYFLIDNGSNDAVGSGNAISNISGKTREQLQMQSTFEYWNFTSVWQMGSGSYLYPVLRMLETSIPTVSKVRGEVQFDGGPGHAQVRLMQNGVVKHDSFTEARSSTDSSIKTLAFEFSGVAPGTYDLVVSRLGRLNAYVRNITVHSSGDITLNRTLTLRSGDVNLDDVIDYEDYILFLSAYGKTNHLINFTGSLNGVVDYEDYTVFLSNYAERAVDLDFNEL